MLKSPLTLSSEGPVSCSLSRTGLLLMVSILMILTSVGWPAYGKFFQRLDEKNAYRSLNSISRSLRVYKKIKGKYPSGYFNLAEINALLDLSVPADGLTFLCLNTELDYFCRASSPDGWTLQTDSFSGTVIRCYRPICPSCTLNHCPVMQ